MDRRGDQVAPPRPVWSDRRGRDQPFSAGTAQGSPSGRARRSVGTRPLACRCRYGRSDGQVGQGAKMLIALVLGIALVVVVGAVYLFSSSVHRVPSDKVGVVYRRYGKGPIGEIDGIRTGRGPGPQAQLLLPSRSYILPRLLYTVRYVPQVRVPLGTIGLVWARYGMPPPITTGLCRHVECDSFQDADAFLRNGGEVGRQPTVLAGGGTYHINPELFEVITADVADPERHGVTAALLREVTIPAGSTGVVIVMAGASNPDETELGQLVDGHQCFQLPAVFLANGGQTGVQAETLPDGVYRLNPWFARVVLIPTRELLLAWTEKGKPVGAFDYDLEPIAVNVEGYRLRFEMTQSIRIPAAAAPRLVRQFGEPELGTYSLAPVQRFVERVLGRTVEGYFQGVASRYTIMLFIEHHDLIRMELEDRIRNVTAELGVESGRTTLAAFEADDGGLDERRRSLSDRTARSVVLEQELQNTRVEAKIEHLRRGVEAARVKAEMAAPLEVLIENLGHDAVAAERLLAELAKLGVPRTIADGDASAILKFLPLEIVLSALRNMEQRSENPVQNTSRDDASIMYFAYGPDMAGTWMASALPDARRIGLAQLKGWRRIYLASPDESGVAAGMEPNTGDSLVEGVLYQLPAQSRVELEDIRQDTHELLTVNVLSRGAIREAFALVPIDPVGRAADRPSSEELDLMIAGATENKLQGLLRELSVLRRQQLS